ncbi:hypothetical protein HMPREF1210_00694 [Paenisporosarcina sp. HGH0030]|uniref:hypothetical protein n=1 Tax=Paenisporosarcina sp. HGH0030 TaxID=1078085 RepID=UPI00034E2BE9|nr:hypothetical protein [Paenisporosarcina sp. HGH0030]EPD53871.1 hypothetical protein HMPREF1210_00694 [Paenisporosarcina sp. HGH0030]
MVERTSTTEGMVVTVAKRRRDKVKSPFLREKATRTAPRTSPSLYTRDLFKRSDEAVDRLRDSRSMK